MPQHFRFFLAAFISLSSSQITCGAETGKPELPQQLNQVLNWLPEDTESLIVANGPFEISSERNNDQSFLNSARSLASHLALQAPGGVLSKELNGKRVLIAVQGSRQFTSPRGLGMVRFEGCDILVFEESVQAAVHEAIEKCIKSAPTTLQVGDMKVGVFTQKWESDEWTILVTEPRPGVLACATDQKFLEQMLSRINGEQQALAFPASLPEWEQVDTQAPVWGLRHYRKEFAKVDPTSPLGPKAAANEPDSDAIGFVFWINAKFGHARYLTRSQDASAVVSRGWHHPQENFTPTIKEIKPGVIEVISSVDEVVSSSVPNDPNMNVAIFLFVLLGYLGHAIYL